MSATPKPSKTTLAWGPATGVKKYKLQYRPIGTANWIVAPALTKNKLQLTGLLPSTTYEWQVQTLCSFSPMKVSAFSVLDTFTTPPQKLAESTIADENPLLLFPVPAGNLLNITASQSLKADITIMNMLGSVMYSTQFNNETEPVLHINVEQWPAGTYLVKLDDGIHAFGLRKFVKD